MNRQADYQNGPGVKNLKAVLFDMDGVLFDSMPNHVYAWCEAVKRFGLHMTSQEVYMNEGRTGSGTVDMLAMRTWGRKATDQEIEEIYRVKSDLFNTLPEASPMPYARDVLEAVKAKGVRIVLVTGSGQRSLLDRLEQAFPGCFHEDYMVTAFDVVHGKPHPEPYLIGLQKAGVLADEAMVVENAPLGVQSGRSAGIYTLALNTGTLPDSVLWESGADCVLPSMQALAEQNVRFFG
ncbi:MAG: HAD family hydrolase [Bacteroidaceae bacterium]